MELKTLLDQSYLSQEIQNCNLFLEKDDRNFHVWNHRLTIFSMIREYFPNEFNDFLNKELLFTTNMIKKNLSNFSAFHYRTKLIPIFFNINNKNWNSEEAIEYFKLDTELITNAVYTDPKDQSPWTYHLWIVNNLTPIYVENYEVNINERQVKIKFSEIFDWNSLLDFSDTSIPVTNNKYSNSIILDFSKINHDATFSLTNKNLSDEKICHSKNNLCIPEILINQNTLEVKIKNKFYDYHLKFLNAQLEMINQLIHNSDSGFLECAHFRKAKIYEILIHCGDSSLTEDYKKLLNSEYEILKMNSKRMASMYEEFFNKNK